MINHLNEIFVVFDFHSNFLVLISVLLNIGKSFKRHICSFNFFSVFLDLISMVAYFCHEIAR